MNLETLPKLDNSFELMKLTDDLLEKTDRNTLRGVAIILLFEKNPNKRQVIQIVKNEVEKYPEEMGKIIGRDLVNRLKRFQP